MTFHTAYITVATKGSQVLAQKVLKVLLNIDNKLSVIEHKLTKMQNEPYISGIDFMNQAALESEEKDIKANISKAADSFTRAGSQTDDTINALSYFFGGCCNDFLGKKNIALYKYSQAFRAACKFEKNNQMMLSNRDSLTKKINFGAAGVGAAAGGATGAYFVLAFAGLAMAPVSVPALVTVVGAGMLIGGSPLYLTTKTGEFAAKMYTRKAVSEADNFYINFTRPLAEVLVERGFDGPACELVTCVNDGARPELSRLQQYVDDDAKWPIIVA